MRAKVPNETGYANNDGVKIYYEIYGEGPETIVFLQPWMIAHSRIFKGQLPYFSERFRCIAFDARGAGKSDRPLEVADYVLEKLVSDTLAVLDHTRTDQAILIGMSYGSLVAAVVAAYHPHRVKAAILVASALSIGPPNDVMKMEHFLAKRPDDEGWNKYNRDYWLTNYSDFVDFYVAKICSDPHSTKAREDLTEWAAENTGEVLAKTIMARSIAPTIDVSEAMYHRIKCPVLVIHGDADELRPLEVGQVAAEATGGELAVIPGGGHNPFGRYPAKINTLVVDFLDRRLGIPAPSKKRSSQVSRSKRALYLSSPIGLGHARRDIAIAKAVRQLHPDLQIDWLAQDPVTRLLDAHGERIHPKSSRLASETRHIELESGEHELNAFQAIRKMDEVLAANFMIFQDAVEEQNYDLVIADEAWDIDHFWHEHPELKRAKLAWLTDFVGWIPMPSGGAHEAHLTSDYNAEMIEHVERYPGVRDRAIFVGNPEDIVPLNFGKDLPEMRDWVPKHFDFSGYVIGEHPSAFGTRTALREQLGYRDGERVAVVTVGGSGVGGALLRRILASYPAIKAHVPEIRMIAIAGPRIDPHSLEAPPGVEIRAFVPNLDRHLAACDVALVQGGLTTCMELTAAGTPFVYFPLKNHFEQNFHVAHRLKQYQAGRRMDYDTATPDMIATEIVAALRSPPKFKAVEKGGADAVARNLSDLI